MNEAASMEQKSSQFVNKFRNNFCDISFGISDKEKVILLLQSSYNNLSGVLYRCISNAFAFLALTNYVLVVIPDHKLCNFN
jgi:peptidyl-tRNA hydrolase